MSHKTLIGAIQGKFWGETQCFYSGPLSEVHGFRAQKNGYCSKHFHKSKWNRFVVLAGKLKITLYKDGGEDITVLTEGMFSDVPPQIEHKFEALEDTLCLEIYWVDGLDPNDIVRKDKGGIKQDQKKEDTIKSPQEQSDDKLKDWEKGVVIKEGPEFKYPQHFPQNPLLAEIANAIEPSAIE